MDSFHRVVYPYSKLARIADDISYVLLHLPSKLRIFSKLTCYDYPRHIFLVFSVLLVQNIRAQYLSDSLLYFLTQ